ncbi:hypothetical protein M0R04_11215 [Candidatus Dojkabacteria bacterium]|jgi:hypothetical protein|nr:hypothetical protein [Candidatus Dojkabacteria bacterium]
MAGISPDVWTHRCLIGVCKKSGSAVQFAARTEDVDINEGSRGGASVASIDGSRLWVDAPQEAGTITMKMRPVNLDSTSATGGLFQQYRGGTYDTSDPLITAEDSITGTAATTTILRDEFQVAILWTNDPVATTAEGAAPAGSGVAVTATWQGLRFYAKSCRITEHSVSFANKEMVVSVTFKFPVRSSAGAWNYDWQSCTTSQLNTLAAYS